MPHGSIGELTDAILGADNSLVRDLRRAENLQWGRSSSSGIDTAQVTVTGLPG